MKMFAGLGVAFLLISGCSSGEHPAPESAVPIAVKGNPAPRVKVGVSEQDKNLARAKALTGLEGKGRAGILSRCTERLPIKAAETSRYVARPGNTVPRLLPILLTTTAS
jgi:hypothetical protein